jgi:hypothetical protein
MSKCKPIERLIPDLYRQKTIDLFMYGYVDCLRYTISMGIIKAIERFAERNMLDEDEYAFDSARITYIRINQYFREYKPFNMGGMIPLVYTNTAMMLIFTGYLTALQEIRINYDHAKLHAYMERRYNTTIDINLIINFKNQLQ